MSKFSALSHKQKKTVVYGGLLIILLLAAGIFYLVYKLQEHARTFTFTADPAPGDFQAIYRYGRLGQEDYENITVDFSGMTNLAFNEIGNPSPRQENSPTSKKYGNLQLDLIYPRGSIYKMEGVDISLHTQPGAAGSEYILTLAGSETSTQVFTSLGDLQDYLSPYIYLGDQNFSTLSIITDAYRSDDATINMISDHIGLTQYGFPSDCEFIYTHQAAVGENGAGIENALIIQELCPPNQSAYFPGLLDSIGYMDKIDFFIKTDESAGSFPIIIDPNDSYAIITGSNIIESGENNAYLYIIDSAARIHLTAHNNYLTVTSLWADSGKPPEGRFAFPFADLQIANLAGQLGYGDEGQTVDDASELQITGGEKLRTSINMTLFDTDDQPVFSTFYARGLFEEIRLNGRRLIKITEEE
jgi:hypothetical protein